MTIKQTAERNIRLYTLVRIFAKRVFLPLSAIYFVSVSGLSIEEIGILGAFSAIVAMVLEVPTGYFADKFGKSYSIRIAGAINALATLVFVLIQNKTGVFLGILLESIGYAFLHGAGEALMHDSLEVLGKPDQYTKVSSRAQSKSLLINAGIIAFVPMTYAVDERLPFLIGTFAYLVLTWVGFAMKDVHPKIEHSAHPRPKFRIGQVKNYSHLIWFAIVFGLFGALYTAPSDLRNLALEEYGVSPEFLGWLFAIGSIAGAIIGYGIHLLKKMPLWQYVIIDCSVQTLAFAFYATGNPWIATSGFVMSMSFWRYRRIVYQDYVLAKYTTKYKATVLSTLANAEQLHRIWLPIVMAYVIAGLGNPTAFAWFAVASALIAIPFGISVVKTLDDD
jgi:MFS family permease